MCGINQRLAGPGQNTAGSPAAGGTRAPIAIANTVSGWAIAVEAGNTIVDEIAFARAANLRLGRPTSSLNHFSVHRAARMKRHAVIA